MTTFDRFQWQNAWVDDPRVYDELLSVLTILLRFANFSGECNPSQATIANRLRKSTSTVQRRLAVIEKIGYLERVNRTGTSAIYMAKMPPTPVTHDACTDVTHSTHDMGGTSPMPPTPVTHAACTDVTHSTHDMGGTSPMPPTPVTHDVLTVLEQSKEQFRSSSSPEVLENPKAENPPPQPPAEILLGFCKQAEIEITIFQAESLWAQVRSQLIDHDEQSVWDYFRWKLSDLTGTEFSTRVKLRFLTQDVSTWLDQQRKRNVGRNDFPAPTAIPNEPAVEPEPEITTAPTVSTDSAQHARQVWAVALISLETAVSRKNFSDWIAPLTPIGIEQSTLHLDAGDAFKAEFAGDTYRTLILDALTAAAGEIDAVKFHPELIF